MAVESPERLSAVVKPNPGSRDARRLRIGRWCADAMLDELSDGATVVKVEPRTMRVLMTLAEQPGAVVSSETLHDTVWRGVVVSPSSIYQAIAQLRRVFDASDVEPYIVTVPRKGYRLVAPVVALDDEAGDMSTPPASLALAPASVPVVVGRVDCVEGAALLPRRRVFAGAAALALVLAAVQVARRPARPTGPIRLAIAPFIDASPLRVDEGLAVGLAQDLAAMLQRRGDVETLAFESVLRAHAASLSAALAPLLASSLGATHVVTGALVRDRRSVRLELALLRPGETAAGWRGSLGEPVEQLAALAGDAARSVISALGLKASAPLPLPVMSQAYELLLLGRFALRDRSADSIRQARDYFQRSIDVDPTFARGHAALASAWIAEADLAGAVPSATVATRVRALLDRALDLDPDLPDALVQRGALLAREGQGDQARHLFDRAIAASPALAVAHRERGLSLRRDARAADAEPPLARAAALDPLDVDGQRDWIRSCIAIGRLDLAQPALARAQTQAVASPALLDAGIDLAFASGQLDDVLAASRRRLVADPADAAGWRRAALAYLDLGLVDPARGAFDRAIELGSAISTSRFDHVQAQLDDAAATAAALSSGANDLDAAASIDASLFAAMSGASVPLDPLERAAGRFEAEPPARAARVDALLLGRDRAVDLAALFERAGAPDRSRAWQTTARVALDTVERDGTVGATVALQRARLAAIAGDDVAAFDALDRAIAGGWRRAWFLRRDPAFASMASQPRFERTLAQLDERIARQRAHSLATA